MPMSVLATPDPLTHFFGGPLCCTPSFSRFLGAAHSSAHRNRRPLSHLSSACGPHSFHRNRGGGLVTHHTLHGYSFGSATVARVGQNRVVGDVLLRMLWLLLLLASGSCGEKNDASTTASAPLSSSISLLEEAVTNNLNTLEEEVTERINQWVEDVTVGSTSVQIVSTSPEVDTFGRDNAGTIRSLELKKTDSKDVPSSPVGPPVKHGCSFKVWDGCSSDEELADAFVDEARFLANHYVVEVPIYTLANATTEFIKSPRMAFGKSPFLTGFGLGFLAFGLKKLLLPFFIGAQIVKSVLVALFLPTLLGHIGKLVGKGLTSVATQSGSSGSQDQVTEFDFKDPGGGGYGDVDTAGSDSMSTWTMPVQAPAPSNAHATLAALNPGRTPGVSQTAQDRPLDYLTTYLNNYATNAIDMIQTTNNYDPHGSKYGHYKNSNQNALNYGHNDIDTNRHSDMDLASEINSDLLDLMTSETQNSDSLSKRRPHVQFSGDYRGSYYGSRQSQKYVENAGNNEHEGYTPKLPSYQIKQHYGSFYSKDPQSDFKVFNKIPSSSQLLTHYDPFYSPLLSRLDSVFKQLGTTSEGCRERLVCDMYRNPAKFAPFSNLVSAQLSRELNELRKPSSDNPEILRFFRYMKAAKDGQDGSKCEIVHNACIAPTIVAENASPMVTTFNDINKLVHARKLE